MLARFFLWIFMIEVVQYGLGFACHVFLSANNAGSLVSCVDGSERHFTFQIQENVTALTDCLIAWYSILFRTCVTGGSLEYACESLKNVLYSQIC